MKNNQSAYTLDLVMLPNNKLEEYNKFIEQYGNASDKYILREMYRVKGEVSQEVLSQHIKNLDALSSMEGFVTDAHKQKIEMVKNILTAETRMPRPAQQAAVETQFWGGSSLLLWFLTLAAIWRRPFYY